MLRRLPGFALLFCIFPVFAQAPDPQALWDYVGFIGQGFRPEKAARMRNIARELERRGQREAVQSIETYLRGNGGTGWVYVAKDGANYIITNHRIISQADDLSITFEKPDGRKTVYTGLSIVAADEKMDIALLAFENGGRPFRTGLSLLDRPPWEQESVYAAGFPGNPAARQIDRGAVSDLYVRVPGNDEFMQMAGPYIRHTAPVDPGNSGGPLLAMDSKAPGGYVVAGINTLSARDPEANYAIPIDRVEDFLQEVLEYRDNLLTLEERLLAFTQGTSRLSYQHIVKYLSNSFTAENAESAVLLTLENAPGPVIENIMRTFVYSPLEGIRLAAAWAVENFLQKRRTLDVETIQMIDQEHYQVGFRESGIPDEWVKEYGIWRIRRFGGLTVGAEPADNESPPAEESRLRTAYLFSLSAGYGYIPDTGHALTADFNLHLRYIGLGTRIYYGGISFLRGEGALGLYLPIRVKERFGITPFLGAGVGFVWKDKNEPDTGITSLNSATKTFGMCISGQGGLRMTSSLTPGFFLQGMYQYNYELQAGTNMPHAFTVSIGYGL
ncbi:MAG: serine protease [Treponema sp.]|jgi:serine protease Do|nr:serine protease [Treponema sp.]